MEAKTPNDIPNETESTVPDNPGETGLTGDEKISEAPSGRHGFPVNHDSKQ